MKMSRRALLQAATLTAGSASLTGCERMISQVTSNFGETIPQHLVEPANANIDADFHLLSRAAYGPWPGDLEVLRRVGRTNWLDQQLHPEKIDDAMCDLRARRFETIHMYPGDCFGFRKDVLRKDISRHTLLRAVYSNRQLFEVMVAFWTDHLNINLEKGDCIYFKSTDDREVIRRHALGRFQDMIRASATSPAMLVYLDGKENVKRVASDIPNENYGRELLELHTLGVDGGYTQKDVFETARCLTGWRIHNQWQRGTVYFDENLHDNGPKVVLGKKIPAGGGASDLDKVVAITCSHPSTARHVAKKLVSRFVDEDPPARLVSHAADVFTASKGDIKSTVKAIFTSEEFAVAKASKIKRPFQFIVSCLRMTGADTHAHEPVVDSLMSMGQGLFEYPTPDGYPDKASHWVATLLWRWNFALALASNSLPSVEVQLEKLATAIGAKTGDAIHPDRLLIHFLGREGTPSEKEALATYVKNAGAIDLRHGAELVGLVLASPAFQRY